MENEIPIPIDSVFVYGTLKKGFSNHYNLDSPRQIVPATVPGKIYDLPYGYPVAVLGGKTHILGELCFLDNISKILPTLDELEEYYPDDPENCHYDRVRVVAETCKGEQITAWIYVAGAKLSKEYPVIGRLLKSGTWPEESGT